MRKVVHHPITRTLWRVLAIAGAAVANAVAGPENDLFVNRILLSGTNIVVAGDNTGATTEPGENTGPLGVEMRAGVWYSWTAPARGVYYLSGTTTNLDFFLRLAAFRGSSVSSLSTLQPRWDGGYAVNANDTVQIRVASAYDTVVGIGGGTGPFLLALAFTPAPANDAFSNRIPLSGTNLVFDAENTGASLESGESGGGVASVWYSYTAHTQGVLYVSAESLGASFDLSLGFYQGTSILTLAASTNSTLDGGFALQPGQSIQIRVASAYDGVNGGVGRFTLRVRMRPREPASGNDLFAQRLDIPLGTSHFEGSIYAATNEPGEPLPAPDKSQTLWWQFLPPEDGLLRLTLAAPYPALLTVFDGADFESMTPLTAGNGGRYHVLAGRTYAVQVASGVVPSGGFALDAQFLSMSNDWFATSARVSGTNWTYSGNFTFATREPGEPQPGWANTIWISWVAPATGRAWVYKWATYQPQAYLVHTGTTLETLQSVPLVGIVNGVHCFQAIEGVDYHFQCAGGADDFNIAVDLVAFTTPPNDAFANAEVYSGQAVSGQSRSVVDATMEPGEPLHLGELPQKSLWWRWQAPRYGLLTMSFYGSLLTNDLLAVVYQGMSVDSLTAIGSGTNHSLRVPVEAGETYHIAVAVPASAVGDLLPYLALAQPSSAYHPVPGNLLANGSFEGDSTNGLDWQMSGGFGGHHFESGGADGLHWPVVPTGGKLWQDIGTLPGHEYRIRFAYQSGGCCGVVGVRVLWDEQLLGTAYAQETEGYWHWAEFVVRASNAVTRVTWTNIHASLQLDAASVIDLNAPPHITRQPQSRSTLNGGNAVFSVESLGTRPLHYQWRLDGTNLPMANSPILTLLGVNAASAGGYSVVITNPFGAVTSTVAGLVVESPTNATILVQPYGDTVPAGGYYNFSVVAAGVAPLRYQWRFQGTPIADATNRNLQFTNVTLANAGTYEVLVQNDFSSVASLAAVLTVTNPASGGGLIDFRNRILSSINAPFYDVDGVTKLAGSNFVAQLYAGTTIEGLRAVNLPAPFRTGSGAGYFASPAVALPHVPGGQDVFAQVRAWETASGASYEEARARGGKFGKSAILTIRVSDVPTPLTGLQSVNLQAGLLGFAVGLIEPVDASPDGVVLWSLRGEPGFRYVVERSIRPQDPVWRPFVVLTNLSGGVVFSDAPNTNAQAVLYRSRILD